MSTSRAAIFVQEGLRMFRRRRAFSRKGFHGITGNPQRICRSIIEGCYDHKRGYFRTSTGHFSEFWTRDFSWCCHSLISLGYENEVVCTIEYALARFSRHGSITTTITPGGEPFDFPKYASDSVPLFMHTLAIASEGLRKKKQSHQSRRLSELIFSYRPFLERQIMHYARKVIGNDGLPLKRSFSSMKDHAIRERSCYDMCMIALLDKTIPALHFDSQLPAHDYARLLKKHFWRKGHFRDTLKGDVISGDANIVPFWSGVISDRKMFLSSVRAMEKGLLLSPFPARYLPKRSGNTGKWHWASMFADNYEGDTVWAHLGMMYLETAMRYYIPLAREASAQYERQIKKHKTFLEVYTADSMIYKTPFYVADEGMLWCSVWLACARRN